MAKTLIHLGSTVQVNFAVLDENGNAVLPQIVGEDGAAKPVNPVQFSLSSLEQPAFAELQRKIQEVRDHLSAVFCPAALASPTPEPEPAPAAAPPEPTALPEPSPEPAGDR